MAQPDLSIPAQDKKITAAHWKLFIISFLGNIMGGTTSTLLSVYLPEIVDDLPGAESHERLSAFISMVYFVGWAIGGLVYGYVADRIGRIHSLAMSICMFGLFTFLIGFAGTREMIVVYRFLAGFGVGGMLVVSTTILSEVWPEKTRSVVIGIVSIGFPLGIFSSGAVNLFVPSWQTGFMYGIFPLITGLISFFILEESSKWKLENAVPRHQRPSLNNPFQDHRLDVVNGSIIFGTMLIGLWAIFSLVPTWVQSLLVDSDGQKERALSMMLLGIGGVSGGFFSGWISNLIGVKRSMLVCYGGCFIVAFFLFRNTSFSSVTLIEIGVLAFLFGISQGLLGVYIPLLFPVSIRAFATGLCFNTGRFLTAAAVFFVGTLVTVLNGYGNSLFTFSFVFLVGFIFLVLSKKITA